MTEPLAVTRTFAAARERVFAAWTTPELFATWWGTDAVDVPIESVSLDLQVGGEWRATMHLPGGDTIRWVGEYLEIEPPARLVFTMTDRPELPSRAPVVVEFDDVDGGTEMTLTQTGMDFSEEQMQQTIIGYNGFFDVMERVLENQS